jgi:hypothetical protein
LLGLIQRLPHSYRTVFNLYAIEGYTHDEIGELLNIAPGTSKSNLHKARQKLKLMIASMDISTKNINYNGMDYTAIAVIKQVDPIGGFVGKHIK